MSRPRHVHVITPGDHFSPRTGSAIPTVVHGLCGGTPPGEPRPAVVVRRDTYPDRYDSADILEYDRAPELPIRGARARRYLDAGLGLLGLPRPAARHDLTAAVREQNTWEPSIIFAHNAPQLVPLVDRDRHLPVLYAHNHLLRSYRTWESGRVLERVAAIIAVSDALADQLAPRLPRHLRERIRVVHNGVDTAAFRRDAAQDDRTPGDGSGPLTVVFLGRMIPEKGPDVLARAVERLDRPDIRLTLVGSSGFSAEDRLTPYERDVRATVARLGDRAEVRPFVPRAEVPRLLQSADVVVVPSRWPDPCPLTVLEGMAAGAAVIGSEIGGIPETLRGVGMMVRPGDADELAAALEALADDGDLRRRTAAACAAYAQVHDWGAAAAELERALEGVG